MKDASLFARPRADRLLLGNGGVQTAFMSAMRFGQGRRGFLAVEGSLYRPFRPARLRGFGASFGSLRVRLFCCVVTVMARMISTTIRLNKEDVRALKRARAAGHSASELVRKGLRVVASRYYTGRRPPSTLLFESTDAKLGDESELFRDLED